MAHFLMTELENETTMNCLPLWQTRSTELMPGRPILHHDPECILHSRMKAEISLSLIPSPQHFIFKKLSIIQQNWWET